MRIIEAFRTNDAQAGAVVMMTVLMLLAVLLRPDSGLIPWWFWIVVIMFWPTIAYIVNLIDPIPKQ